MTEKKSHEGATTGTKVMREHRRQISAGRALICRLIERLSDSVGQSADLEAEITAATAGESSGRRRDAMLKAVSLPAQAVVAKDLAAALRTIVTLEREAFGLDDSESPDEKAIHITISDADAAL